MENVEVIVGRNATLRLSLGTARLLYRGVLTFTAAEGRSFLPERVRAYIDRRRAMLGCSTTPIDLRQLLASDLDGQSQRALADLIGRIARSTASQRWGDVGISPAVRLRLVAALIEVYRLICANLPLDLTLPPPMGLSLSCRDWIQIEIERDRIRAESAGHAAAARSLPQDLLDRSFRDEVVHREISVFAG